MSNYTTPLLSVIVPVYKVEKFVGRCLNSIIAQTFTNWECIIVDDGSPDNCGKICDEYAQRDNRIKVIHQQNGGLSIARNEGIKLAKGKYLTFIDSDDAIEPNTFLNYINYINKYDWVMVGVQQVDSNLKNQKLISKIDKEITSDIDNYENTLITATKIWMMFGPVWNKIYRTDIIKDNHIWFVPSKDILEDRIFNIEYAGYAKSVALLPYIGYKYVINPNSITHKKIKSIVFFNSGIELDNILRKKRLGSKMQEYTALFVCRYLTRAFIEGLISKTNRWSEINAVVKFYLHSHTLKQFRLKTLYWSLSYIIEGIIKKR